MTHMTIEVGYPINPGHNWVALSSLYALAEPFPHVVIDDFLDKYLARELCLAVRKAPDSAWKRDDHANQVLKTWIDKPDALPQIARDTLLWFNSGTPLVIMQKLTGIKGLLPDMTYHGGGVHRTKPGGMLSIHCDYNVHPVSKLHRRVNALYFLNEGWRQEWGGQLELWDTGMTRCVKSIEPISNRLVVFTITDTAFHGVPNPVQGQLDRYSMALYYFTGDRPDQEKAAPHMAIWQKPR